MAVHTITLPDMLRGDEPRTVIWDDEAGTVSGTHSSLPDIRETLEAPKPVTVGVAGRTWRLRDPARDPAEFLVLLNMAHWEILTAPHREALPPVFDGVDLPAGEPDEELYDAQGRLLT